MLIQINLWCHLLGFGWACTNVCVQLLIILSYNIIWFCLSRMWIPLLVSTVCKPDNYGLFNKQQRLSSHIILTPNWTTLRSSLMNEPDIKIIICNISSIAKGKLMAIIETQFSFCQLFPDVWKSSVEGAEQKGYPGVRIGKKFILEAMTSKCKKTPYRLHLKLIFLPCNCVLIFMERHNLPHTYQACCWREITFTHAKRSLSINKC